MHFAIVKFATSITWKADFAGVAAKFEMHKLDLQFDLQMYTSITITNVTATIASVNDKMAVMMEWVFANMQSPQEKALEKVARQNGGVEGLLENSKLKKKLFEMQEEEAKNEKRPSGMPTTLAEFEQELAKDVKTVLEENRKSFEKTFKEFESLLKETKETVRHESDRVIEEVLAGIHAGPHEQIIDKVLHIACL